VSAAVDSWLCKRAAAGDGAAFDKLIGANRRKLLNVCQSYAEGGVDQDDLFQMVCEKVWHEIERGHYNPFKADLSAFWSTCAYQVLRDDKQRRRAQKRWSTEGPAASMETLVELEMEPRSFNIGADPLEIVMAKETLVETIAALTRGQLQAVKLYAITGGVGAPATMVSSFVGARKRARPIIADLMGAAVRLV
jgi:RNA polymerase sigma factor (sigma-70 family)